MSLFRAIGFYQCLKFLKPMKRSEWWAMFSNLQIQEDMTIWELFSHHKGTQGIMDKAFFHRPFKGKVKQWSAVTAACCITVKENFLAIGGFDEVFVNGCEDVDLCLRMTEKGLDNYVVHDSVVYHIKCASHGRLDHNMQNEAKFLERWEKKIISHYFPSDCRRYVSWYLLRSFFNPRTLKIKLILESLWLLISKARK